MCFCSIYTKLNILVIKAYNRFSRLRNARKFRHIFLFYSIIGSPLILLILFLFNLNFIYFMVYLPMINFTYLLIDKVSEKLQKDYISKKELFNFIIFYIFIISIFVFLFAQLYIYSYKLNNGRFFLNDKFYPIKYIDAYYISGITLLNYDTGLMPDGLMKIIIFIQLFISQIMILGFFFIIFGDLIRKINKMRKKKKSKIKK